jgi:hypothetical protein
MTIRHALRRLLPLLLVLAGIPAQGEGPLYVGGEPSLSGGFVTGTPVSGKPFHWDPTKFPLTYWTDQGNLGGLSKTGTSGADALVQQAFQVWQDVATASITFSKATDLGGNVTASNAQAVIDAVSDCSTLPGPPAGTVAKPRTIIYDDSSGSIMLALGDDPNVTLGFADAVCFSGDGTDDYFNRGYAVLNGKGITSLNASTELKPVMIHEFGHMIGLDHSQINLACLGFCGAADSEGLPTMFPILVDGAAMSTPATDDIAGVSALYPTASFSTSTATITGNVYFSDGITPAQGFNVIARRATDPRVTAVSNVSGYLFTGDAGNPLVQDPTLGTPSPFGSHDPSLIGVYEIPGLPPGDYTVEVEGIHNTGTFAFVGGSGLNPIGYLGFEFNLLADCSPLFLSNTASLATCNAADKRTITVSAGQTKTDTDIILIGTTASLPRYDAYEDGP